MYKTKALALLLCSLQAWLLALILHAAVPPRVLALYADEA